MVLKHPHLTTICLALLILSLILYMSGTLADVVKPDTSYVKDGPTALKWFVGVTNVLLAASGLGTIIWAVKALLCRWDCNPQAVATALSGASEELGLLSPPTASRVPSRSLPESSS
jgi:hypothetical protein